MSKTIAAVAFPVAIPGVYDYRIPERFLSRAAAGLPVLVEVKKRKMWGVIIEVKSEAAYPKLKEIIDIKEGRWADSNRSLLKLYKWMAEYYQCPVGRVFKPLIGKAVINKKAKVVTVYRSSEINSTLLTLHSKLIPAHREALDKIKNCTDLLTAAEIELRFGVKASTLTSLHKKGLLVKESRTLFRGADELSIPFDDVKKIALSSEQQNCVDAVAPSIGNPGKPFLLYGVTGSGKTHVYTELAKKTLEQGRGVIILVPEISLTPQTIHHFLAAVGDTITVIHSRMSDGERRDSLQEIAAGNKRAVIGVRSALLAPMDGVGLIIVDEEHDGSYKQSDTDPRYNARDMAVMRGAMQNAAVVLGSATPSIESYYNALTGKYRLLTLTERFGTAKLPNVKIVDMTAEHKENNWTPLSRYLVCRMEEELSSKRQIILLLNRRGFSISLLCKGCGYSHLCANCSVNMRYHKADTALKCHLCGREEAAPEKCPKCDSLKIKYKGTGIQKAEELLREQFPEARILRMDQDTTRRKGSHVEILDAFAQGKADILLGTQMVAKGLNFPNVTLVGVLQADTGLHFPDFRASERTFQLLTQVAGRAGRAELPGEVIIQTYCPNEAAVRFATEHDYLSFYEHEIKHRKELSYPPFGKLARIVAEGAEESIIREFLHKAARAILSFNNNKIKILGPAPAVLSKIDNVNRYSMILKSLSPQALSKVLAEIRKLSTLALPSSYRCVIDVDPVNML
ncbi:MAG: primosomal protein N' [Chitinispirillales bacterium]|jgi:primosomal protein N' (replication factor Y)|nr:primosomal protein N' [Chitinispirillales bacterium]